MRTFHRIYARLARALVHTVVDAPQGIANTVPAVWRTTRDDLAQRIQQLPARQTHVILNTNYQDQSVRNAQGLLCAVTMRT